MTKARDTAEVTNVTIAADAVGDILAIAHNLNNSGTSRVAAIPIPGGATPTGVSVNGSLFLKTDIGSPINPITAVSLDTKSCAGMALVVFTVNVFSTAEVYQVTANSADASITITY